METRIDRPQRQLSYPREHYEQVAEIWLEAWGRRSGHPTTAVAKAADVRYSTAARWVKRARELGVLTQDFKRAHICPDCGHRIDCSRGEV